MRRAPLKIRSVLIADGDTLFRVGLRETVAQLLPEADIAEAGSASGLAATLSARPADLVLLDLGLPGLRGYLWLLLRRRQHRGTPWLAVSGIDTPRVRARALACGIARFVSKRASSDTIAAAVRAALRGAEQRAVLPASERRLIESLGRLTPAELRMLAALPEHSSQRELMRALNVSLPTVKTHMSRVLAKLQLRNRTEAAVLASRLSILTAPSLAIDRRPDPAG
ncbi:MAG TPA: response regulator transcription factor [Verrucomicrobiae bacterium]|nr:response regulator transcription factor [Verrucomicrobiae bacterium]